MTLQMPRIINKTQLYVISNIEITFQAINTHHVHKNTIMTWPSSQTLIIEGVMRIRCKIDTMFAKSIGKPYTDNSSCSICLDFVAVVHVLMMMKTAVTS